MRAFSGLVVVAVLLGGCAAHDSTPAAPPPSQLPAGEVVLQVADLGGFTTPQVVLTRLPMITVYGDGLVLTEAPQPAIYPAVALPSIEERRIPAASVARLVRLALDAGVGSGADLGQPGITDHATTRLTVVGASGVLTTDAYALSETDAPGVNAAQSAARKKLRDLVDALTDLPKTIGAPAETKPYVATAVAAYAQPWSKAGDLNQPELRWPGPELPGSPFDSLPGMSCTVATGDTAKAVFAAAQQAKLTTPWLSGDQRWVVALRPLLPGESGCEPLPEQR